MNLNSLKSEVILVKEAMSFLIKQDEVYSDKSKKLTQTELKELERAYKES